MAEAKVRGRTNLFKFFSGFFANDGYNPEESVTGVNISAKVT